MIESWLTKFCVEQCTNISEEKHCLNIRSEHACTYKLHLELKLKSKQSLNLIFFKKKQFFSFGMMFLK